MWRIPLSDLNFNEQESKAVQSVLDSGWLTMGPRTQEFETWFAAALQAPHAVAVANCTCALELSCRYVLEKAEHGRRAIIAPDITFVATTNAIITAGGQPLLVDIESPSNPALSYEAVKNLLTSRDDIAGVIIMHYAGADAGVDKFQRLCEYHNVALIEDCAHSPQALSNSGHPLGTIGLSGCFSFFSNKNLATGEGGMIVTADEDFYNWARLARSHGVTSSTWARHIHEKAGYDVLFPGHNYRCTEITSALGLAQLTKLPASNMRRQELTSLYVDQLQTDSRYQVIMPSHTNFEKSACHILSLLCESPDLRNAVKTLLTREEIQTSHHYRPIHTFTWYRENNIALYSHENHSTIFAEHQITLPLYPAMPDNYVIEITDLLKSIVS